ncbi:hypothetical protein ACLB2K_065297 [Fragaria x ananassa]
MSVNQCVYRHQKTSFKQTVDDFDKFCSVLQVGSEAESKVMKPQNHKADHKATISLSCCCFDLVVPIRSNASSEGKSKKCDEWRFDSKKERGFATHLSRHRHPPHPLHRHKDELSKRRRLTVDGGRLGVSRISCCCSDLVVLIRSNASSEGKRKKCDEWWFDSKNQRPHKAGLKAAAALPFTSAQVRRDVLLCDIHTDRHKHWGQNRSNFACWGMC